MKRKLELGKAEVGRLIQAAATILFILGFINTTTAQTSSTDGTTPLVLTPGAPSGSYPLSGFDNVNLFNGNLNFRLPLVQVAGRGDARYSMLLPIETHWRVLDRSTDFQEILLPTESVWAGDKPGYGPGLLFGRAAATDPGGSGAPCGTLFATQYNALTRLTFILPDGTEYEFRDQATGGQMKTSPCAGPGYNRGSVFVTADGTAATFVSDSAITDTPGTYTTYPSGYLLLANGLRYRIDNARVSWIRDRNGNKLTFSYNDQFGRVSSATDSLNRQVTITYADFQNTFYDQISFKAFGGAQRTIRVNYALLQNVLRMNRPGDLSSVQTPHALFPELTGSSTTPYNPYKVSSVVLPDGTQQFQFAYNVYGELARVILPTGGMFEYDFSGAPGTDGPDGVIYPDDIYRRVFEKRVYRDTNTQENKTVFNGWTVDVLDPSGTTLLGREKHYFYGSPFGNSVLPRPFDYPPWNEGKEYQTEVIDTANCTPATCGTVLRRTNQTWQQGCAVSSWSSAIANNPRIVESDLTLADTNQVSKQTFGYDCFNNKTDVYEYDYGATTPARHSHTDYMTTSSYTDWTGAHLRSLPTQTSIFDANEFERARTTFEYDNHVREAACVSGQPCLHDALVPRSGISGECDGTSLNCPNGPDFTSTTYTVRGNVTMTTRYLLDPNTNHLVLGSIAAYAQYDIAGNVVKSIDARSTATNVIATTLDFADRFGAPDAEATSNTSPAELSSAGQASYAFPTLITNAAGQTFYSQIDFYLGRPVNTQDANGIVSAGYFNDALDRPTQMIRAVNDNSTPSTKSQTTFAYDDTNHVITTTNDQANYGDNVLKGQAIYDGLGRTTEKRQYEGATNYIAAQTQYDLLGRAYKTSNPFRPGESVVWSTTGFDALGRVNSITTPDNAVVNTYYNGSQVLVKDQAGKERMSQTNALGQLTDVWEITPVDSWTVGVSFPNHGEVVAGYRTVYGYDTLDDLTSVTQGAQPQRTFVYDSLKRLISAKNPEMVNAQGVQVPVTYQYDNNGNLTQKTDARGVVTTLAPYDALNRPTSKSYSDGTPAVNFFYDSQSLPGGAPAFNRGYATGRLVAVTYGGGSQGDYYGLDAVGRAVTKIQQTSSVNYIMSASYNLAGAILSENYPSTHSVSYLYDAAGRTNSFAGNLGEGGTSRNYTSAISYSPFGGMAHEELGTATAIHNKYLYNVRGQIAEIRAGTTYADTSDTSWNRGAIINHYGTQNCWGASCNDPNNNGNLRAQDVFIPLVDTPQPQGGQWTAVSQQFDYDALNRLQDVHEGSNWYQTFHYDRWGNRTIDQGNTSDGIPKPWFGVDPNTNRLTVPTGYAWSFDNAGNLTNDTYTGQGQRTFDAENRMTAAQGGVNAAWQYYAYDGTGQRIKRTVNGVETRQVYGIGGELIAEYSSAGALQKEYGYRNGQLLITATVNAGGWGSPPSFDENPLVIGQTPIRSAHITQLRTAIDALRSHYNLGNYPWAASAAPGDPISIAPIQEMRAALDQALGPPQNGYTGGLDHNLPILKDHIQELRQRVLDNWQSGGGSIDLRWLVSDQLGTPRIILDANGSFSTVVRHDYLPYGEELITGGRTQQVGYTNNDGVRQKFTGQQRDDETTLDYFNARYYQSMQGRFTSPDIFGGKVSNPQSLNLYGYVMNNPLKWRDPSGHWMQDPDKKKEAQKYGYEFDSNDALVTKSGNAVIFEVVTVTPNSNDNLPSSGYDLIPVVGPFRRMGWDLKTGHDARALGHFGLAAFEGATLVSPVRSGGKFVFRFAERLFIKEVAEESAVTATGTIWDAIVATEEVYSGTVVPRSFTLATESGEFYITPNATEHLAEYAASVTSRSGPEAAAIATQAQLTSLRAAVTSAAKSGVRYGELIESGGWKIVFGPPRSPGELPAVIHALMK
jgi:RHS repeat-associated protein